MNICRNIGFQIQKHLMIKRCSVNDFAYQLGYSLTDAYRITEGRVCLSPKELQSIADFLNVSRQDLLNPFVPDENTPNLLFIKEFNDIENLDKCLDLIDLYADLKNELG